MSVQFYERFVRDNFKSAKEGKDVGETKVYMRRSNPIDKETVADRLATDKDRAAHPLEWGAFANPSKPVKEKPKASARR